MRKRLASLFFAGAAAAAAVAIAAPSAFASGGVWTVSPSPDSFSASLNSGTTTILSDSSTGVSVTCSTSKAAGTLSTPASGNVLGSISSISWSSCSGVGGLATGSATGADLPWSLAGTAYNASVDGGQTTGAISGPSGKTGVGAVLSLTIAGSACTATVGGTTASPATATGGYDNTSGLLATISTANLKVLSSNCLDINTGNTVTFSTSPASTLGSTISHGYAVSPKPKIVDP